MRRCPLDVVHTGILSQGMSFTMRELRSWRTWQKNVCCLLAEREATLLGFEALHGEVPRDPDPDLGGAWQSTGR